MAITYGLSSVEPANTGIGLSSHASGPLREKECDLSHISEYVGKLAASELRKLTFT